MEAIAARPYHWRVVGPRRGWSRRGASSAAPGARRIGAIAVCLACLIGIRPATPTRAQSLEAKVKASYVLNFTRYTEWPGRAFAAPDTPIVVCTLDDAPFASLMERTFAGRTSHGRRLVVLSLAAPGDAGHCHVVFLPLARAAAMDALLDAVVGRPVLTVSDAPGFLDREGMLELRLLGGRIRFEAHLEAAARVGLKFSSALLAVAHDVRRRRGRGP